MTDAAMPPPLAPLAPPAPRRRAFVTYLMFNDSYLPGCLMAAYGLRRQHSVSRRVCAVTPDISRQAREALATLYDAVVQVEYIGVPDAARNSGITRTGS